MENVLIASLVVNAILAFAVFCLSVATAAVKNELESLRSALTNKQAVTDDEDDGLPMDSVAFRRERFAKRTRGEP